MSGRTSSCIGRDDAADTVASNDDGRAHDVDDEIANEGRPRGCCVQVGRLLAGAKARQRARDDPALEKCCQRCWQIIADSISDIDEGNCQ